jgi:dTDP-4-amino-4,6-dideoxygalactose transaminase
MEGVQGLVLERKLRHLSDWTAARRNHAEFYLRGLNGLPGLTLPTTDHPDAHVWHLFVVLVKHRDKFRQALELAGVATGVHYPTPIPYQPAFAHLGYQRGAFPVTEDVMNRCVSLPMFPELTAEQRETVVDAVKAAVSDG